MNFFLMLFELVDYHLISLFDVDDDMEKDACFCCWVYVKMVDLKEQNMDNNFDVVGSFDVDDGDVDGIYDYCE